jgi:hypothetical protein
VIDVAGADADAALNLVAILMEGSKPGGGFVPARGLERVDGRAAAGILHTGAALKPVEKS